MTSNHFLKRIKKASKWIEEKNIDLLWIESPHDIFYFTGQNVSRGMLFISKKDTYLALDGRYSEQARSVSPVRVVLDKDEQAYDDLFEWDIDTVGINFSSTHLSRFEKIKKIVKAKFVDCNFAKEFRTVKDQWEIRELQKAANILWQGYLNIKRLLKRDLTEKQLAWEFEKSVREQGATGLSFSPIIAFGISSSFPHYTPSENKRKEYDPALVDIGCTWNYYQSDMTRTFIPKGADKKLFEIEEVVIGAYEEAFKACKIGASFYEIDHVARDYIRKKGFGDFFPHSLGHGVGIDVHEYPLVSPKASKEDLLIVDTVFTIEPGIYLPGIGGYRYENTVHMTENGPISFFPHDN